MERRLLIVFFGLPGAGKSSLAKEIAQVNKEVCYVNIGQSGDFGKVPMAEICAREYCQTGQGRHLITEAVLGDRASRRSFVDRVKSLVIAKCGVLFSEAVTVFLDESLTILSTRRNRSVEEYLRMYVELQTGKSTPLYLHYVCASEDDGKLASRAKRIWRQVQELQEVRDDTFE